MSANEACKNAPRPAPDNKLADAPRAPRQMRGRMRVEAILDAAAAIITEEGVAGVTMHVLARRAQTSIGSLYHFFPDRESVLEALCERHDAAIRKISRQLGRTSAAAWRKRSVAEAIDYLVKPYVEYLLRHDDYLPLMRRRHSPKDGAHFMRMISNMLEARLPNLAPVRRQDHIAMLHAIAAGTMHQGSQEDPDRSDLFLREIPRVLTLYLSDIEALAAAQS